MWTDRGLQVKTIALLGQPNSGKSTFYNALTGSHQRVGNWPGKTVEKAEGEFFCGEELFRVADLPGSYGLTANSEEEVVTRNFIERGNADLVCLIVDASQLERSLFMVADFAGIRVPSMLLLNMMDVALSKEMQIDCKELERKLGIPVLGFTASDTEQYPRFFEKLKAALQNPKFLSAERIREFAEAADSSPVSQVENLLKGANLGNREPFWVAAKLLENDGPVRSEIQELISEDRAKKLEKILQEQNAAGGLLTGEAKYRWISELLQGSVVEKSQAKALSRFDRIATHFVGGKVLAFFIMTVSIFICMMIAMPGVYLGFGLQAWSAPLVDRFFESLGILPVFASLVNSVIIGGIGLTICMTSFIFSILFIFSLMENVGYMARFSFVFDAWLSKLGLHGKAIMPLFAGLSCTAGAVCGTRVLDTRGQRLFAMVLMWGIPCGSKFAVVLFLASAFFGSAAIWFALAFVVLIFLSFFVASKLLGKKLLPEEERVGMIMELPPYHKPHWKNLCKMVLRNTWSIFKKAACIIVAVSFLFWLFSYSGDGRVEHTILYRLGNAIEPVTQLFGMRWQLLISYIGGVFSKEASLGVMNTIFLNPGDAFSLVTRGGMSENFGEVLRASVTKPEALAFVFASMFNIPCVLAMGTTFREVRSWKWSLAIVGYYFAISLGLAFIAYHIGLLIF